MNKSIALLMAGSLALTGCVAYEVPSSRDGRDGYPRDGHHRGGDRDRDGVHNQADRDRDGDGVRNREDRRPDDPRRY